MKELRKKLNNTGVNKMENIEKCPLCDMSLVFDEQNIVSFPNGSFHFPCVREVNSWILTLNKMPTFPKERQIAFYNELKTLKSLYPHPFMQNLLNKMITKAETLKNQLT